MNKEREEFIKLMSSAETDEDFMKALYHGIEDHNDPAFNLWLKTHTPIVLLERKVETNSSPTNYEEELENDKTEPS